MRSKRSKAWHRRKEIQRTRELIEQGVLDEADQQGAESAMYVAFTHPSIEADLRALEEK